MSSPIAPLLSDIGQELLHEWQKVDTTALSALEKSARLRQMGATPDLAAAILTQADLRERAAGKFGSLVDTMIFTRDGYEQATRRRVADRHAERFRAAGATHVADLGCGNGADSTALLRSGLSVHAVDIDEDAAACARWNLQVTLDSFPRDEANDAALPLPRPSSGSLLRQACPSFAVKVADVTSLDISALSAEGVDAIFADPARRTGATKGASRVMSPEQWSPPLSTVLSWQEHVKFLGVKVAPGIEHEFLPADFCVEWVSVDGDLVEAALWSPALSPEGRGRQAVVIVDEDVHVLRGSASTPANAPVEYAPTGALAAFLAEPDPAVIRAGLVGRLAEEWNAHTVSEGMAYLSADAIPDSPFAQRFEVVDVVGLKPKAIAGALGCLNAHSVEVKKRGSDISPEALRRSIRKALVPKNAESEEITVIATRIAGKHQAILARRV